MAGELWDHHGGDGIHWGSYLRNLVGPPRFELGTSCTPNSGSPSIGYTDSRVLFGLHGFGASASAHRRWPENHLRAHFCAQFSGLSGTLARRLLFHPNRNAGFRFSLIRSGRRREDSRQPLSCAPFGGTPSVVNSAGPPQQLHHIFMVALRGQLQGGETGTSFCVHIGARAEQCAHNGGVASSCRQH